MVKTCKMAGLAYENLCLSYVQKGISIGAAGPQNKNGSICDLVEISYQKDCLGAAGLSVDHPWDIEGFAYKLTMSSS